MNGELPEQSDQQSGTVRDPQALGRTKRKGEPRQRLPGSDRQLLNTVALLAVLVFLVPFVVIVAAYVISKVAPSSGKEQDRQQEVEQKLVGQWIMTDRLFGPKDGVSELSFYESGHFVEINTYPSYVNPGQEIILKYEGKWRVPVSGETLELTLESVPSFSVPSNARLQKGDVLKYYIERIEASKLILYIGSPDVAAPGWEGFEVWVKKRKTGTHGLGDLRAMTRVAD